MGSPRPVEVSGADTPRLSADPIGQGLCWWRREDEAELCPRRKLTQGAADTGAGGALSLALALELRAVM